MKRKILAFGLIFGMLTFGAFGGLQPATPPVTSVTLAWDSYISGTAASFNVYYGTNSLNYSSVTNITPGTAIQATLTGLPRGVTNFYNLTVVSTVGLESVFAGEVSNIFAARPAAPTNPRVGSASQ